MHLENNLLAKSQRQERKYRCKRSPRALDQRRKGANREGGREGGYRKIRKMVPSRAYLTEETGLEHVK